MLSIDPADEDSDDEGGKSRPSSSVATSRALSAMGAAGPPGGAVGAAPATAAPTGTPYPPAVNSSENPVIVNSAGAPDMTHTVMRPPTPFENNIDSRPSTPYGKQPAPQENSMPNAHSNTNSTMPNDAIVLSDSDSNDASKVRILCTSNSSVPSYQQHLRN